MSKNVIEKMVECGVVAVVRAPSTEEAIRISKACVAGGIKSIELTFTVKDAPKVIELLNIEFKDIDVLIGAGTVINKDDAVAAIKAGSRFIVGPNFDEEVCALCQENEIPYMPGCLTPTEVIKAMNHGCEVIKIFPGSLVGPSYLKALKGPLPQAKLMPTGGVNLNNTIEWIKAGAVMIGIGGELTSPSKTGDYEEIIRRAQEFTKKVQEGRV